jgi:hypothetical protein
MPELGPYGSMRGARGNSRPYRDHAVLASIGFIIGIVVRAGSEQPAALALRSTAVGVVLPPYRNSR